MLVAISLSGSLLAGAMMSTSYPGLRKSISII